jgi:predicted nucleotidyltransferase
MMITSLVSRRQREKILAYVLGHPSRGYRVREIAKTLDVSAGSVSQYLALLKQSRIMRRRGNSYFVDLSRPLTKALKIVLNVASVDISPLKSVPGVLGIGVYGSWANGMNEENSDIDIWVKVKSKIDEETIAKVSSRLRRINKSRTQLLVIDPQKNRHLREEDPIFYYSLVYGSVVMHGETLSD